MTMPNFSPAAAWNNESATTAVEFAIVAPVFILLSIGVIYLCLGLYAVGSLQYAVEEAARCASVKTTICTNSASIVSYAKNHFYGAGTAPSFSNAASGCGHSVSATLSYVVDLGLTAITVPLSASACFP
jgi:Flp pilus assembly protein TadG